MEHRYNYVINRILKICAYLFFLVPVTVLAQNTGTISGKVIDSKSGEELAGVNIYVSETQSGASTNPDGSYTLSLPAGNYTMRISYIGYNTVTKKVSLSAGQKLVQNFELSQSLIGMNQAVVLGSRSNRNRTVINSAVPIDVLNVDQLRTTGMSETSKMIQALAPSFNFPRPSITDGTDAVRPATLRGLGPGEMLVLVNGKRRYQSALVNVNGSVGRGEAGVDLNAIPSSAIDHIEILRDGAAAQYGSDAISGVINIVLKKNTGLNLSSKIGQTTAGDGSVYDGTLDYGFNLGNGGFMHITGEYLGRGSTNRVGPDPRQQYFGMDANGNPTAGGSDQVSLNPNETTFNRYDSHLGDPVMRNANMMFNSSVPVGEGAHVYAFGGIGYRDVRSGGFFRRSLDNRDVRAIWPDGFLPVIHSYIFDVSIAAGVKGATSSGWTWDISDTYGYNSFNFGVDHSVNVTYGVNSPTKFNAGTLFNLQNSTNIDISRDYHVSDAHTLTLAFGGEFRVENYHIHAGQHESYDDGGQKILDGPNAGDQPALGSQVFPGFRPNDAVSQTRSNIGLYADVENDISDKFRATIAGRYEHYNDFGSTLNGEAALRYSFAPALSLRGGISTGFSAPQLQQSNYSTTSTVFIDGSPFEIRTFPVRSQGGQALGASQLKPEKSVNISAGFTSKPVNNLSFTFDYYHIYIQDRIVLSSNFVGSDVQQLLDSKGVKNVTGGRYFTNAANTMTDGFDVVANYGIDLSSAGIMRFTGAFNYNQNKITKRTPTPSVLSSLNTQIFDRSASEYLTVAQPKTNLILTLNYNYKKFDATVRENRYGKVTSLSNDPTRDQTYSAKWITDVNVSYPILPKTTLAVGANNVFDVYPDRTIDRNNFLGIYPYSGLSPFGFNGAFYYARIDIRL